MSEKLKEYLNKYKKYIIAMLILIIGVFLLNFLFVITDWIAGKGLNICAIIYSPVSNEEWLSFIGNGIVGLATLLLFWIAKKSFENERNKVKYENEMNEIYHELVDLRNMYGIVLENISTEIIDLIKVKDLNERKRKINSINKINKEAKEKFLDILKKYKEEEFLKENLNGVKIENEVEYGNFLLIFNTYLNYVINKVKEYFINAEKDIKEEFLRKNL